MKKLNLLIIFILFALSCNQNNKDELFKKDADKLKTEIDSMANYDQFIRQAEEYGSLDTNNWNKIKLLILKDPNIYDSINDTMKISRNKDTLDLINKLMANSQIDFTKRMFSIIEKYGFPSSLRDSKYNNGHVDVLISHFVPYDKTHQMQVLETEFKEKRMNEIEYEIAKWNLNLREGLPKLKGIKMILHKKDGTDSTIQN